jgi:hypothetical protein
MCGDLLDPDQQALPADGRGRGAPRANSEAGTTGCDECTGGDGVCSAVRTAWTLAADLNTAVFAGETDWRVPKRKELVSIVDYFDTTFSPVTNVAFHGASSGIACTDITGAACRCTQSSSHWSASSLAPNPGGGGDSGGGFPSSAI